MHGILKITIYFILNIKMLNELKPAEVMDFLKERGYEVIELEWYINKTSALENAESSSIWRALWFMGIWITDSIASADEIIKATNSNS